MNKQSKETRRQIGCGYELVQIKPSPWTPENMDPMWKPFHPSLSIDTCPGYTMNLPETQEIAQARMFFDKGDLGGFCDETPTMRLREGVIILEGANNEVQRWAMDNPEKK